MATQQQQNGASASGVLEQLRGKHVLITGTTGFLGKVVLEKLIRTVPDLAESICLSVVTKGIQRRVSDSSMRSPVRLYSSAFDTMTTRRSKPFLRNAFTASPVK